MPEAWIIAIIGWVIAIMLGVIAIIQSSKIKTLSVRVEPTTPRLKIEGILKKNLYIKQNNDGSVKFAFDIILVLHNAGDKFTTLKPFKVFINDDWEAVIMPGQPVSKTVLKPGEETKVYLRESTSYVSFNLGQLPPKVPCKLVFDCSGAEFPFEQKIELDKR